MIQPLSLATSVRFRKGEAFDEKTSWHAIEFFGDDAKHIANHAVRGQWLYVEGSLEYQEWTSTEGVKKNRVVIQATDFKFGPKPQGDPSRSPPAASDGRGGTQTREGPQASQFAKAPPPRATQPDDDSEPGKIHF